MRKIVTIAIREYKAMVATKAFLISIVMMPILMLGSLLAVDLLKNVGEVKERAIAVIDQSAELLPVLMAEAQSKNERIRAAQVAAEAAGAAPQADEDSKGLPSTVRGEILDLRPIAPEKLTDALRAELSDQIRDGQLYAFVEIPADVVQPASADSKVRFYSQDSSIAESRGWFASVINDFVKSKRLKSAGIDPQIVSMASQPVTVSGMSLVTESADGSIVAAKEKNQMADIFLPLGAMMFMFLVIFMASQPMLEAVLEEKAQRIAEVLLGSASPFQLMSGKLLGTVGGSMTVFLIYLAGGFFMARNRGMLESFPLDLIPWFIVFQVFGVLFYAAIFMAVGASVSQLKEAQAMLLPVWMMLMLPIFIWFYIVQDPRGSLATWISFFPPATSTTMILRMATGVTVPLSEILLATALLIASTVVIVILAGRIFRVGILWQGKVPKLTELLRWAWRG